MAIGRLFKVFAFAGGGLLAMGGGALGTHFAYPFIEKRFFPERRQREEKLKQTFNETSKTVEALGKDLNKIEKLNESQKKNILFLTQQASNLNSQIQDKNQQISQKEEDIRDKSKKIEAQEEVNKSQKQTIDDLNVKIGDKGREIQSEKDSKEAIQTNLDAINQRLHLTRDDVLTDKTIRLSSTYINTRFIKWKEFNGGGISTFDVIDHNGSKKSIKMKKNGLPNHEQKALEIRKHGITFKLGDAFRTWVKKIKLTRYDIDYDYHPNKDEDKKKFTKNNSETTIRFSDYFNSDYYEEAFKVLLAIAHLENPFLCHNVSDTSPTRPYLFCEDSGITQVFVDRSQIMNFSEFNETESSESKFVVWTNRFVTENDFIRYWTMKTVEFVRTGTVDLLDFMNPMLKSEYYKSE